MAGCQEKVEYKRKSYIVGFYTELNSVANCLTNKQHNDII